MTKAKAKPRKMTAAQFVEAYEALGLNQEQAAAFLQIGLRTCARYASEGGIPRAVQLLLLLMIKHEIKPEDV
jgi:hypothetical protein